MKSDGQAFHILVIEDNPVDVQFVQMALDRHHVQAELEVLGDGEEAIERFQQPSKPGIDLVLLDLNLPKHNGLTVLEKLRGCVNWQSVPVIIITAAESTTLPILGQWLGANLYFSKPMDLDKFMELGLLIRHMLHAPATI